MDFTELDVEHNVDKQCFQLSIGEAKAVVEYELLPNGVVNFIHTFVPPSFRGKGVAEKLVGEALTWANAQGLHIRASCWYVAKFINK